MLPWGHAAVGYLIYSLAARLENRHPPDGWAVVALGFGTQFPDLVDKPLAWSFGILVAGRSLAHSVLTLTAVAVVLLYVARRRGHETVARAFLVGYATHLATDAVDPLWYGNYDALRYLLYPLVAVPTPERDYGIVEFFLNLKLTPLVSVGLVLAGLALGQWVRDGLPGLAELRGAVVGGLPWGSPERRR